MQNLMVTRVMNAKVKFIVAGLLSKYTQGKREIEIQGGVTVKEALDELGIPSPMVGVVLVNGVQVAKDHFLEGGETVKLVPLIGGG